MPITKLSNKTISFLLVVCSTTSFVAQQMWILRKALSLNMCPIMKMGTRLTITLTTFSHPKRGRIGAILWPLQCTTNTTWAILECYDFHPSNALTVLVTEFLIMSCNKSLFSKCFPFCLIRDLCKPVVFIRLHRTVLQVYVPHFLCSFFSNLVHFNIIRHYSYIIYRNFNTHEQGMLFTF